ncbi:hypothetical protein DSO57_1034555 [Entomophthora muscae]|uniref:Uncharacterized protein n=1 Tax=Entomophthora muscae TaxID=34485 RepID=A0ACC2U9Y0_9FUNG|nr:hypothetical protein DSO57_1034555 [Entomophthora muscae]
MELQRGEGLLKVDSQHAVVVCDQCRVAHRKCDRSTPKCLRCVKKKIECTRFKIKFERRVVGCLSKQGWILRSRRVMPTTWSQVVETHPMDWLSRIYLRRYVMPMALLLPEPTVATDITKLSQKAMVVKPVSKLVTSRLQIKTDAIQDMFTLAMKAFFSLFNPFKPLFSEEAFYSRPRSLTLRKILVQIGLQHLPQTELTRQAALENNLVPNDILNLPTSLDSLQCIILAQFGVWLPWMRKLHFRIFCLKNRMLSLLGLHVNKKISMD